MIFPYKNTNDFQASVGTWGRDQNDQIQIQSPELFFFDHFESFGFSWGHGHSDPLRYWSRSSWPSGTAQIRWTHHAFDRRGMRKMPRLNWQMKNPQKFQVEDTSNMLQCMWYVDICSIHLAFKHCSCLALFRSPFWAGLLDYPVSICVEEIGEPCGTTGHDVFFSET